MAWQIGCYYILKIIYYNIHYIYYIYDILYYIVLYIGKHLCSFVPAGHEMVDEKDARVPLPSLCSLQKLNNSFEIPRDNSFEISKFEMVFEH